ncbi:MAG: hypothetical protein ACXAEU_10295 [Candidatus Hodarchaeales archaeon]|jgi:hypothetical protein
MTTRSNSISSTGLSGRNGLLLHHVIDSLVMAIIYGMQVNAGASLDVRSISNNLNTLMHEPKLQHLFQVEGLLVNNIERDEIKKHLKRLFEAGFLEHDKLIGKFTLTDEGYKLGKIRYANILNKF